MWKCMFCGAELTHREAVASVLRRRPLSMLLYREGAGLEHRSGRLACRACAADAVARASVVTWWEGARVRGHRAGPRGRAGTPR